VPLHPRIVAVVRHRVEVQVERMRIEQRFLRHCPDPGSQTLRSRSTREEYSHRKRFLGIAFSPQNRVSQGLPLKAMTCAMDITLSAGSQFAK
jgi:hypothetical protein